MPGIADISARELEEALEGSPDLRALQIIHAAMAIGVIAHSCGVREPRQLKRFHCRVVQDDGRSVPLDELYPDVAKAASAAG